MSGKTIAPSLGSKSFTCPHCGANAHQTWYALYVEGYEKDGGPWMPDPSIIPDLEQDRNLKSRQTLIDFFKRKLTKKIFREKQEQSKYHNTELINLYVSVCYSCDEYAVWVADNILYPAQPTTVQANDEMPDGVRLDFLEAANIVDQSPRGAAALLRLCVQKILIHLSLKGKNIDDDIGILVKRGLDVRIQQALDVVRVIGNHAVHPGQIDLRDNKATAIQLFELVNLIVDAMIAAPKRIEKMYGALPEGALKAIEKRDGQR